MSSLVKSLQHLHTIHHYDVIKLTSQFAQQQDICARYQRNINALMELKDSSMGITYLSAAQLSNHSSYKTTIQRVIDWQKQELILATKELNLIQQQLTNMAKKEKTVELVLAQEKERMHKEHEVKEQKITDNISLQNWLRRHHYS